VKFQVFQIALVCTGLTVVSHAAAPALSQAKAEKIGERCWSDVRVLADDNMEGRRAGSPGHRRAAEFVAEQFRKAGLAPGGDDGFLQPVKLESRIVNEAGSSLTLVREDSRTPLVLGDDAVLSMRGNFAPRVDAPMVFVGDGLQLPQYKVDDLAGLDLKGKVVVAFSTAPPSIPGSAAAHFGSAAERWKVYRAAGAVGVVFIADPENMDVPWERQVLRRFEPTMVLRNPAEDLYAGMQVQVQLNPKSLGKLFEGTGHRAEDILEMLKNDAPLPHFDLKVRLSAVIDVKAVATESENVVGVFRGSDPKLRDEYVVISAHLDHLGIASVGDGDRIYNGAMDNASGIAVLMQMARELGKRKAPARSIVFAAVTAEEMGLLGSRAYVSDALARKQRIVANLNTDMFLPLFPMRQVIAFGLEESELGDDVRAVAAQVGMQVQTDPQPQRNRFIRSDQYSFIRQGIPALATKVGFTAGSPEAEFEKQWTAARYHAVGDDLTQPVDFGAIGRYEDMLRRLTVRVANRAQPPRWLESSVFSQLAR
jgi:peptidase M28-like protein